MFGFFARYFITHLREEIAYLRAELRFQRDENQRLQNALVSFKFGGTVSTLAPAVPREVSQTTSGIPAADALEDEFANVGSFEGEPMGRTAL